MEQELWSLSLVAAFFRDKEDFVLSTDSEKEFHSPILDIPQALVAFFSGCNYRMLFDHMATVPYAALETLPISLFTVSSGNVAINHQRWFVHS